MNTGASATNWRGAPPIFRRGRAIIPPTGSSCDSRGGRNGTCPYDAVQFFPPPGRRIRGRALIRNKLIYFCSSIGVMKSVKQIVCRLSLLIPAVMGLLSVPGGAQTAWRWTHPVPQGNSLLHVAYAGVDELWAVGAYGTILHTFDGGLSWRSEMFGLTDDLIGLAVIDPLRAVAVGDNGVCV